MKFTITFLALFASVAASTFSSQVDARVGGDRNLNSNDGGSSPPPPPPLEGEEKYSVYFANSCNKKVGVTAEGHSQVIPPNDCQAFNGQYSDSITYKISGGGIKGGNVSCKNIGSSNNDKCNLLGMPRNACVITIDLCGEPAPTRYPTRAPTPAPINEKYTVYFANSCNKKVDVTAEGHSEVVSPNNCQAFNGGKQYSNSFTYKESGSGIKGGNVSCKNIGSSNNDRCDMLGMPDNACVITIDLCGS